MAADIQIVVEGTAVAADIQIVVEGTAVAADIQIVVVQTDLARLVAKKAKVVAVAAYYLTNVHYYYLLPKKALNGYQNDQHLVVKG